MTDYSEDIAQTAESFTTAFYQGDKGHARDQFKNSVAAMVLNERERCASIVKLIPLGPFKTADDAVKAAETQAMIADAVEKAGWKP